LGFIAKFYNHSETTAGPMNWLIDVWNIFYHVSKELSNLLIVTHLFKLLRGVNESVKLREKLY
jgi:hypothetical protein